MPAFYIVLQENIPGVDGLGLEGRALSKHNAKLEAVAKIAGAKPLANFFSASRDEIAGLLEDQLIPEYALEKAKETWFPAEEGLETLEALMASLSKPKTAEETALVSELSAFQRVLQAAQSRNVRWHLGIDY